MAKAINSLYSAYRRSVKSRSQRLVARGITPLYSPSTNVPTIRELQAMGEDITEATENLAYIAENFEEMPVEKAGKEVTVARSRSREDYGIKYYNKVYSELHQEPTYIANGRHVHERHQTVIDFSKETIDPIIDLFDKLTEQYQNAYGRNKGKSALGYDLDERDAELADLIDHVINGYSFEEIGSAGTRLTNLLATISPSQEIRDNLETAYRNSVEAIQGASENAKFNEE